VAKREQTGLIKLKDYEKQGYNVLAPTTHMQQISPFHRIRVEFVKVDPDPDNGEVYKVGSKYVGRDTKTGEPIYEDELTFSKVALMKFADAAGITWNWKDTRAVTITPDYVYYEAVGALRKASGEWIALKGSVEIDLKVKEQEIYQTKLTTAKSWAQDARKKKYLGNMTPEQWAKEKTAEDMLRERKYKLRKAETAAMERVIRAALQLKQKYSPTELQKTFAIPKVDFSPDYNDPEVRRMMVRQGIQASNNLFGATPIQTPDEGVQMFNCRNESQDPVPAEVIEADDSIAAEYTVADDFPEGEEHADECYPWEDEEIKCQQCGGIITEVGDWSQEKVLEFSRAKFNGVFCGKCISLKLKEMKERRAQG
jgi:hypothetical protein